MKRVIFIAIRGERIANAMQDQFVDDMEQTLLSWLREMGK